MPQPVELDELQDPLISAYRRAWTRIEIEQQEMLLNPLKYRRRLRLVEMQRRIAADMDALDESAANWIGQRLPRAYALGMQSATAGTAAGGGAGQLIWSVIHEEAVEELAYSLFQDLLAGTKGVKDSAKKLVRDIAKDESLQALLEGRTAQAAGKAMERRLAQSGIHAITYANGAKHGLAEYSEMAMRTKTATAYNHGYLNAEKDVKFFEVFDGPDCGWAKHDDPMMALGRIVTRDEALAQPISHPNCRRAFGARPDILTLDRAQKIPDDQIKQNNVAMKNDLAIKPDKMGKRYDPWGESLTPEQRTAFTEYQVNSWADNAKLRAGKSIRDQDLLDSAFTTPVGQVGDTYRVLEAEHLAQLKVGDVFIDPAYLSTSVDRQFVQEFAEDLALDNPATMKIRVLPTQKAAWIDSASDTGQLSQGELLLPRETPLQFLGKNPDGTFNFIALQKLPSPSSSVRPGQTTAQRLADATRRTRKAKPQAKPKLPPDFAENAKQASRRAKLEARAIREGKLLPTNYDHPPGWEDFMPPMEATATAAKSVAKVPTIEDLINKGFSPADAIKEHKRLVVNARNAEARARRKALGLKSTSDLDVAGADKLTFAEKSTFGSQAGQARTQAMAAGKTKEQAEVIFENTYRQLVAARLDDLGFNELATKARKTKGEIQEAIEAAPKVKSAKELLVEADIAQKPKLGALHLEPLALHSQKDGPGGIYRGLNEGPPESMIASARKQAEARWIKKLESENNQIPYSAKYKDEWIETSTQSTLRVLWPEAEKVAWYDRMTVDRTDYIPVVDLQLGADNYIVKSGIATRRDGISYLMETPDGVPIDDAMRAEFEKHIAKVRSVILDIPLQARKYQHGYAIVAGRNPADEYWGKKYGIADFKSAATGGNGGTTFWGAENVTPTTMVHEMGHNFDSMHPNANPTNWLSQGAAKLDGRTWDEFRVDDQILGKNAIFKDFVETRPGGHPILIGKEAVSEYGKADIKEDFAESFRLYMKDRREGKLGYLKPQAGQTMGVNVRFSDVFPQRARFFDEAMGLSSDYHKATPFRSAQLSKIAQDFDYSTWASGLDNYVATLDAPNTAKHMAGSYAIPEAEIKIQLAGLKQSAYAAEQAKQAALKAAAEAAAAKAALEKPLTWADIDFKDKTGIGVKAANAKKAWLKGGGTPQEAQQVFEETKAFLIKGYLDAANAKRGIASGSDVFDVIPASVMRPVMDDKLNKKARGFVHPTRVQPHPKALKQSGNPQQLKANIAAEIADRMNNREDWEIFIRAQRASIAAGQGTNPSAVWIKRQDALGKSLDFDLVDEVTRQKQLDQEISARIQTWAGSSGDSNIDAVAMQMAVRDEFKVTGNPFAGGTSSANKVKMEQRYSLVGEFYRRFARRQYEFTQDEMKAAGITEVSVWRGMNLNDTIPWGTAGQHRPELMPANSWSTNRDISLRFGRTMFSATVPRERVLGSARTGFGCHNEYEYVIFDSDGLANVEPHAW